MFVISSNCCNTCGKHFINFIAHPFTHFEEFIDVSLVWCSSFISLFLNNETYTLRALSLINILDVNSILLLSDGWNLEIVVSCLPKFWHKNCVRYLFQCTYREMLAKPKTSSHQFHFA